jgi:type IV pilus assembly protein PilQ
MQTRPFVRHLALFLLPCLLLLQPAFARGGEVFVYKMKQRVAEELLPSVSAVLSPEGRVSVDARTNSLVIIDRPESLDQVKALLATQDVRLANIEVTVETLTQRDLDALHVEVDWAFRSGGWQIGTIPAVVPHGGFTGLGTAGADRERGTRRAMQTVTVMDNGSAEISTGHKVPFTDVFYHYAHGHGHLGTSTRWISVDTGFTVHARTIGSARILLTLTPWMRNLGGDGSSIQFTEASTQIEVKEGESAILGSSSRDRNEALAGVFRGGARVKESENTFLRVTARKR